MTSLVQLVGAGCWPRLGYDTAAGCPVCKRMHLHGLACNTFIDFQSDVTNSLH